VNESVAPRAGEEIDTTRLGGYLAAELGLAEAPTVRQFPSGFSNLTYLVTAGERSMVLRRPPVGSTVKSAHDMGREVRVLQRLRPVYPLVPAVMASCDDLAVLGYPFYLMELVPGVILRARLPPGVQLDAPTGRRLANSLFDNLAALHALELEASGLAELGHPQGYVARQVNGWAGRYDAARTDTIPELEAAFARLAQRVPPERGAALVHNDYKHDNVVLDPSDLTRIRAVLDWEMATVGDPLLDLGTTLGYWVEAQDPEELRRFRFGPTDGEGQATRADLVARYAETSGRDVSDAPYYYAFGLCKIAVIAQQIYFRFRQGLTKDPRFAFLLPAIRALGAQADAALGSESV